MIKRALISFYLFSIFLAILTTHYTTPSNAKETSMDEPAEESSITESKTEDSDTTSSTIVKYNLAYPGILPDHPLYKLKVLRDKISVSLISDPRKKVDFYLLQTDKGILASAMLVDKGKIDLAQETALKAEHNYTLLTQALYRLPVKPGDDFFKKLQDASLKHREVLMSLGKRVPKDKQKTFLTVVEFSERNWEAVEKYKSLDEEIEEAEEG